MIRDAMQGWLEIAIESGHRIPEPRPEEEYSGKFVVRVPKSLHRRLVERAEEEGVSLNQYINVALATAVAGSSALSARKRAQTEEQDVYTWESTARVVSESPAESGYGREELDDEKHSAGKTTPSQKSDSQEPHKTNDV